MYRDTVDSIQNIIQFKFIYRDIRYNTVNSTITVHVLYKVHSIIVQYTVYSTQYTVHSILYTVYSTQYTVYSTQYTVQFTVQNTIKLHYYSAQYTLLF